MQTTSTSRTVPGFGILLGYGFVSHRRFRHHKSALRKNRWLSRSERGLPAGRNNSVPSRRFTRMPIHRRLGGTPSLLVLLALGVTSHVQAQGSVFKSTVEVVPLTVTVTDAKGRYLKNLVETDFAVLEEGVRQPLAFFANEPVPIDLALTIDASASMARLLPIV